MQTIKGVQEPFGMAKEECSARLLSSSIIEDSHDGNWRELGVDGRSRFLSL